MRTARSLAVLLLLSACAPPVDVPAAAVPAEPEIEAFVRELNEHRVSRGCRPLVWDEDLARVAQAHSRDMHRRGFYGHEDPEGRGLTERLSAAGIRWVRAAENVARTSFGAEQVLFLWLQSEGHRENIENCRLERHGVGLSGEFWTHVFVTPPR